MPKITLEIPHTLGKEAALEKTKTFLERVKQKYADKVSALDGQWSDNVLTFKLTTFGITINGTLTVEETVAKFVGDIPFAAMMFKGQIEKGIREELEKCLKAPGG
jgi:hypothetical protein